MKKIMLSIIALSTICLFMACGSDESTTTTTETTVETTTTETPVESSTDVNVSQSTPDTVIVNDNGTETMVIREKTEQIK